MRKLVLAIVALLSLSAADARPRGAPDLRVQVSLSSYGATCNGVADDTAAFLAFKAANQGATPLQLNLPTGTCTFLPAGGSAGQYMFKGVRDLVVNGQGAASTTIKNTEVSGTQILMGGTGQTQDNAHSLRTNDATAGDSCVTIKTQPAVTVSDVQPNVPYTSTFTASASGTTLTVTAVASGTIVPGATLRNSTSSANYMSIIQPYGTAGTTGIGGTGTYAVSQTISFTSRPTYTVPASYTASVDLAGVMTVSAVADGTVAVGLGVYSLNAAFGGAQTNVYIKSQIGGTPGGAGTYQLSASPQTAITSQAFTGEAQIRVKLNSTAGLSTGDTLYLTGITASGLLQQRSNGLKWIKVINGTQVDLFQWIYDGSYVSGGTGGGDRTSLTPTGSKVLMTGYALQAYWGSPFGFPSNPHYFEYKTVASTSPGTHQVCFDTPLANSYKASWPQMSTGSQFEVDPGGPATLYAIDSSWEATYVFQNLTLDSTNAQTYSQGRNVTISNVTMTGGHCAIPTQNEIYTWTNVNAAGCNIETDKQVKTWNITNSSANIMTVQSSSMDLININTMTVNRWFGSPKRLVANALTTTCTSGCVNPNTDASFMVGTTAYGATDEVVCTNCSIAAPPGSTVGNGLSTTGPIQPVNNVNYSWSMSGGVITIPNALSWNPCCNASELQMRGLVPGHYAFWSGNIVGRAFKVVDVTQDVDNTYVTTSEAGGFPTGTWASGDISVSPHPAPMLTLTGSTGANTVTAIAGCPAQLPIYSCQIITNTGGATGSSVESFKPRLWGVLDTFTFTNNVPYTGGGSLTWQVSRFNNWPVLKTDLTLVNYGASPNGQAIVNMKLPSSCGSCTRTLTASGATNTQVGDTITVPPTDAWFGGVPNNGPIFSADTPSDSPQVTMTLRTNQQLPP